jgi:hypothetical protein
LWSLVLPDQTVLMSSRNFSTTPRKTTSRNSCKNLSTMQRSDQGLRTSRAATLVWFLVWPVQTLGVSSSNFSATPWKTASINSYKFEHDPTVGSGVTYLLSRYSCVVLGLPDQMVLVSSGNFSATPWRTTSRNSCKNLSTMLRLDQEL